MFGNDLFNKYFCKKRIIMALAIKSIPVLEGEDAERFVKEAEEKGKNKNIRLSKEKSERLKKFLEKSRNFTL